MMRIAEHGTIGFFAVTISPPRWTHEVMLKGPLSSQTSLVLQHWRGELSLPVSFWLRKNLGTA
jgi:hypothetical protein